MMQLSGDVFCHFLGLQSLPELLGRSKHSVAAERTRLIGLVILVG